MQRLSFPARRRGQRGMAAVEFSFCAVLFFLFVCGVIELARALYLYGSMVEVTRRAARTAAFTDFSKQGQIDDLKKRAMFEDINGGLPLRGDLTSANLKIDYLNASMAPITPPVCPAQNYVHCSADPEGASCIRFVRVRLCSTGSSQGGCTRVDYKPILNADFFPGAPLQIPTFATVTPAGSLGYQPGVPGNCL